MMQSSFLNQPVDPALANGKTLLSRIRRSRWRVVVQSFAVAGMILQPAPMARSYWTDTNNDGIKEWVDNPDPVEDAVWYNQDSDGDQMTNGAEVVYGSDPYRFDSDFDGLNDKDEHDLMPFNDPWNWSSDGSGYSDHDRYYHALQDAPLVVNYNTLIANNQPFYSYADADGDGIQNQDDPDPLNFDRDGDGILNWQDGYMDDPNNGTAPPDTTTDTDGDGIPDYSDPFPHGSYLYNGVEYGGTFTDTDGDGVPDPLDAFSYGSYTYNDVEYAGTFVDSDNDGIPDPADLFPNGSYWYNDVEYGGGMVDNDNDGIPDPFDPYPNGSYVYNGVEYPGPWVDSDQDGIPDAQDPFVGGYTYNGVFYSSTWIDTDGDGIPDPADLFPNGSYLYNGTEYPGYWVDQDNDGIPDSQDAFPTLSGSFWYGGIEYGGAWADGDNDGVPDAADPWPTIAGSYIFNNIAYPGPWTDADYDGIPDAADPFPSGSYTYNGTEYGGTWTDSDSDGVPDPADLWPAVYGSYWYNGTEYGGTWVDTDGDTIPDPADDYPNDRWNGQPYYAYNGIEYAGTWTDRDNDGVPDPADSWPDDAENGLDTDLDGLDNYTERTVTHTLPTELDSDQDYLTDGEEVLVYHTNPLNPRSVCEGQTVLDFAAVGLDVDTDDDGIPDLVEEHYCTVTGGLSKTNPNDASGDLDGDGVTNLQAYNFGWNLTANLNEYDQDGDGISDVIEDMYPSVLDKTVFVDAVADPDGDGLMSYEEVVWNLDPGNGYTRGAQIPDMYSYLWARAMADPGSAHNFLVGGHGAMFDPSYVEPPYPGAKPYHLTSDINSNGIEDGLDNFVAQYWPSWFPSRSQSGDWDGDGMADVFEHRHRTVLDLHSAFDAGPVAGFVAQYSYPNSWDYIDWAYLSYVFERVTGSPFTFLQYSDGEALNTYLESYGIFWGVEYGFYELMPGGAIEYVTWRRDAIWDQGAAQAYGVAMYRYAAARKIDADGDGLSNIREFILGTNPEIADSDGDGLQDGIEVKMGLNPNNPDSDGDGLPDGMEDSDGDKIPNAWEIAHGLDPARDDGFEDPDGDRIPNVYEFANGEKDPQSENSAPSVHATVDPAHPSSTNHIYANINAAINYINTLPTSGYYIIAVKPGTYSEYFAISTRRILLMASAPGDNPIIQPTTAADAVQFTSNSAGSVIRGFTISGNGRAFNESGSGVYANPSGGSVAVIDCIIRDHAKHITTTGNYGTGAGIVLAQGKLLLAHCTFVGNRTSGIGSTTGGNRHGIGRSIRTSPGTTATIINSILWNETSDTGSEIDASGTVTKNGCIILGEGGGDPLLTAAGFLTPYSSSPRGDGVAQTFSKADIQGETRSLMPDVGSDEWVDSDNDNMADSWERSVFAGSLSHTGTADDDNDGLSNFGEYMAGTNPLLADTDGDGLGDRAEAVASARDVYPTAVLLADDDGDGLTFAQEQILGTNPNAWDTNGDGISDGASWSLGLSPTSTDPDGDGLSTSQELAMGTSPILADTDGDGVSDSADKFPLDPSASSLAAGGGDTTAPVVTLTKPPGAVPLP